jgi:hypothetical protein
LFTDYNKGEMDMDNKTFCEDDNEEINTGKSINKREESFLVAGHRYTSKTLKEAIEKECR